MLDFSFHLSLFVRPYNAYGNYPGPTPTVTIDGNSDAYSGFFIPMGNVILQNMIFQNLAAKGGHGGDGIAGGGGGGGLGSRANTGTLTNLGNGGSDQDFGLDGNGYGLASTAGSGGEGNSGGSQAGGGGGGGAMEEFTFQALSGIPTIFNTSNNTTQAGTHGTSGPGGTDGTDGSALGNSIFLRTGSSLTFMAYEAGDLLTLGEQVAFTDDTLFGIGGTTVFVKGNGTVVYNGTTDYQGSILINNANFKVNGQIDEASILVCRNIGFSTQRGTLSGVGTLSGDVFVNSGTISPDTGGTLTLGSLSLNPADPTNNTLGSLVHITIDANGTSLVSVTGPASLAGTLEIDLDPNAQPGSYTLLTSSSLTGTFDAVTFTGNTPNYTLFYLPAGNPTFVQLDFLGYPNPLDPPSNLRGKQKKNDFGLEYELYNQLIWTPSPSPEVTGYFVYRNGKKIATVETSIHTYTDHNRKKGVTYIYAITAFNSAGTESAPVTIALKP